MVDIAHCMVCIIFKSLQLMFALHCILLFELRSRRMMTSHGTIGTYEGYLIIAPDPQTGSNTSEAASHLYV